MITNKDPISKITFGICIFRSVLDALFFCKVFGVGFDIVHWQLSYLGVVHK